MNNSANEKRLSFNIVRRGCIRSFRQKLYTDLVLVGVAGGRCSANEIFRL